MSVQFPGLLKPGKIGNIELNNRIVSAPMGTMNGTHDGFVTQVPIDFYTEEAKGGIGLIIVEGTYIDTILSKAETNQLGIWSNEHVTGWARLVTSVHDQGAKIVLQLCHIGHQVQLHGVESLGPSEMTEMMGGIMPFPIRGITREEMEQIKEDFAECSFRAKMASFDGVQIHGAIDHLLSMFCSSYYNRRTDEYGGSAENRIRYMIEIVEAVKERCGRNFPIIARVTGCDYDENSLSLEDGVIQAKLLEQAGVKALHVVGGSNRTIRVINGQYDPRGDFIGIAKAMKDAGIKISIILDGGFTTPDIAEKALADGVCDFIGLGRPTLADPYWAKKVKEGRPEDIVPCIRCLMGCTGYQDKLDYAVGLRCSVNPRCNLTAIRKIEPAEKKKRICIIGGGPAGMEAARVASLRGHSVTLYEKRKLGGTMHEAAFDDELKGDIKNLIAYYCVQMTKPGITVINEEATAEKVLAGNYDAVIVAAGASPVVSKKTEMYSPIVRSVWDYCSGMQDVGDRVVIVGGGFVACEIALSLAKKGKHPIIATTRGGTMGPMDLADENSVPQKMRLLSLMTEYDIELKLMVIYQEATDHSAIFREIGEEDPVEIECDSILLCRGYKKNTELYRELKGQVPEIYNIGDSKEPRIIHNAIEEGFVIGNRI